MLLPLQHSHLVYHWIYKELEMKNIYKILLGLFIFSSMLLMNSCDIQDDAYLILNMDTELNAFGVGQNISTSSDFCLSDFNDYNDNVDNLEGIEYLNAAYFTTQSSNGLKGDLTLKIYQGDGTTLLCEINIPDFNADDYLTKPLQINLSDQEIKNINSYLVDYKNNKCFKAELTVTNVSDNDGGFFQLIGEINFLAQLKVKSLF
jgi:hypothetical protein